MIPAIARCLKMLGNASNTAVLHTFCVRVWVGKTELTNLYVFVIFFSFLLACRKVFASLCALYGGITPTDRWLATFPRKIAGRKINLNTSIFCILTCLMLGFLAFKLVTAQSDSFKCRWRWRIFLDTSNHFFFCRPVCQ